MPPSTRTARAGAPPALREPRFTGRDEQLRVLNLHLEDRDQAGYRLTRQDFIRPARPAHTQTPV